MLHFVSYESVSESRRVLLSQYIGQSVYPSVTQSIHKKVIQSVCHQFPNLSVVHSSSVREHLSPYIFSSGWEGVELHEQTGLQLHLSTEHLWRSVLYCAVKWGMWWDVADIMIGGEMHFTFYNCTWCDVLVRRNTLTNIDTLILQDIIWHDMTSTASCIAYV